ncbi:hypothetical protein QQX98_000983 [Neonectria punicea]|uniref:Zn(2)-C6 fungal-type domain-containing protein n=1 Tax=Neonectria punicea TaxID=979145 RepID=A0ABR1HQL6_9HYPO
MADQNLAQFTNNFRVSKSRRVKRNRQTVSCTTCRARKSRCDRQQPCGACEKRGDGAICRFDSSPRGGPTTGGRREIQSRLRKLEDMVRGILDQATPSEGIRSDLVVTDEENRLATDTQVSSSSGQTSHHIRTSWEPVMDSIQDIRRAVEAEDRLAIPQPGTTLGPDVAFGCLSPVTTNEVLQILPSRQAADRAIAAYFNAKYVAVPFIHTHQFRRQYEAFWEHPESSNLLWASILFSILGVGTMVVTAKSNLTAEVLSDSKQYVAMSARCLVSGQYSKGEDFSVEALVMHAHTRYILRVEDGIPLSSLYGLAVRLAQRRGYHRDLGEIPLAISPFEAEMRRRVWFVIESYDLLFSFEQGVPPLIHEDTCDTGHPLNLADDDFDEDTICLCPRLPTEPLPILAYICQSKLLPCLRRIICHGLGISPCTYGNAELLSKELEKWHATIPPCLRARSIQNTAFTDPNYTVMQRIMLELIRY